jgi:hypothetical protein
MLISSVQPRQPTSFEYVSVHISCVAPGLGKRVSLQIQLFMQLFRPSFSGLTPSHLLWFGRPRTILAEVPTLIVNARDRSSSVCW